LERTSLWLAVLAEVHLALQETPTLSDRHLALVELLAV
jgi:hypothetical protein